MLKSNYIYIWSLLATVCIAALVAPLAAHADVKISGVSPLGLGTWYGSGNLQSTDSLCVFNDASSNYQLTITAPNAGTSFT